MATTTQTLLTLEKVLKINYLPVWNNMFTTDPSPILSKIRKVALVSDKIQATFPVGIGGGYGAGYEGKATPAAGARRYENLSVRSKDMYVNIAISQKAISLSKGDGALVDALDTEIKAAYEAAKWNIGRSLFGNGTGKLATVTGATTASTSVTVDSAKYLIEGLTIDIFPAGATDADSTHQTTRILNIDRTASNPVLTLEDSLTIAANSIITCQNSLNREITGLGAIFDTSITSIYGMNKAGNSFLTPITESLDKGTNISDDYLRHVIRDAHNYHNSDIDMLLCGDNAYDNYLTTLRTYNQRYEESSHVLAGGFKALKFIFANREVDVVNESFVPDNEIWGFQTNKITLHQKDWSFCDLNGGGIFNLMENQSVYRALLCNYGELICENPGGCLRIVKATA